MTTQPLTFSIEKAPSGGYFMRMGDSPETVDAARSSLAELMDIVHMRATEKYGESCFHRMVMPPPYPEQPRPHVDDRPVDPATLPDGMPAVVENYRDNGGMMGELYGRMNGKMRAVWPALFLAGLWFSINAPRFLT